MVSSTIIVHSKYLSMLNLQIEKKIKDNLLALPKAKEKQESLIKQDADTKSQIEALQNSFTSSKARLDSLKITEKQLQKEIVSPEETNNLKT